MGRRGQGPPLGDRPVAETDPRFIPPIILAATVLSCQGPEIPGAAAPEESDVTGSASAGARFIPNAGLHASAPEAGTVVLEFEGYPSITPLPVDAYAAQGVTVSGAVVLTAPGYNWAIYPPHGGAGVISGSLDGDAGTPVTVTLSFDRAYTSAEVFVTSRAPVELNCTTAEGISVGSASSRAPNLEDDAPYSVYLPNDHIQVTGAGIRGCTITGPGLQFVVDDVTLSGACPLSGCIPPAPTLQCNGASGGIHVTRGDVVTCTATMSDGGKIAGARWLADPEDGPNIAPAAGEALVSGDGLSSTWSGPLILNTKVKVWLTPDGTTAELSPVEVDITADARPWAPWTVGTTTPGTAETVVELHVLDNAGKLPRPHISDAQGHPVLGFFNASEVDFPSEPVLEAVSGPNREWSTLKQRYSVGAPFVYIHPDLFSGPWYNEQNGGTNGSSFYCTQADIARLVTLATAHEYLSSDSHLAHWNTTLSNLDLQGKIERIRKYRDPAGVLGDATNTAKKAYANVNRQELAWDATVYSGIYQTLGCDFDNIIGDGR